MLAQIIVNSIIAGSVYALAAFGFTLIYGTMKFFNMSYGVAVSLGAYLFYLFYGLLAIPLPIALAIAIASNIFIIILIDRLCFFRLRTIRAPSWALILASMGIAIIVETLISMIFGSDVHMLRKGIQKSYIIANATITPNQLITICVSVFLMVVMWLFLKKTRTGKAIRAITNDQHMATVIGIDIEKMFKVVMVMASFVACISGVLIGLETDIDPYMSHPALLRAIIVSIIGGIGKIGGAMWGGLLLGFVENFGIWKISAGWKDGIALAFVFVIILFKPSIFGIEEKE